MLKIGEGHHREIYIDPQYEGYIFKILKRKNITNKLLTILSFSTMKINKLEYEHIQSMPKELNRYLPGTSLQGEILMVEKKVNYDGTFAQSLKDIGPIDNKLFWEHITAIKDILMQGELFYTDIFNHGDNILVHKVSEEDWMPVLIDLKRFGSKGYAFQPLLHLKSFQLSKFIRRYERFQQKFHN